MSDEVTDRSYEGALARIETFVGRERRVARGERHGSARFTSGEVRALRQKLDSGELTVAEAAELYKCCKNTIYSLKYRKTYIDVED